ncbi:MAG: SocA family protein [Parcubacteria group bacterium]|nr:SocA family protein [Parcubacteria group bacterium]
MTEKQVNTSYRKTTQALNLLARKKGGKINKMKAIKLIFLADRLHLRKYGRPIVGDVYWAMKLGPVGSLAKNIAELNVLEDNLKYAKKFIKPIDEKKQIFVSLKKEDLSVFSKTDLECISAVYEKFSDLDQFELADITHNYSEWTKHEKELYEGKKRVKMDYDDFFIDTKKGDGLFSQSKSDLKMAKESFIELKEVSEFFVK